MSFTFIAHTGDLCQALAAVAPFTLDKVPTFATVRLFVDHTNVWATATNGNAGALAIASTLTLSFHDDEGVVPAREPDIVEVDLLPAQCKAIVALFKAGAVAGDEDDVGAELRIEVTEHEVVITDDSGLLEGQSLTLPRAPLVENAAAMLVSMDSRNQEGAVPRADAPPRLYGPSLALVLKAAKIYGHPIELEHKAPKKDGGRSGSTLIRCGDSFLALLVDTYRDGDEQKQWDDWKAAWGRRLPIAREAGVAATDTETKD